MIRLSCFIASSVVLGALALGCDQPAADDGADIASSEVRTRNCPTSLSLTVSNVAESPIPDHAQVGGSRFDLSARDRAALGEIQAKFVAAGTIDVTATLSRAADGVCTYRQTGILSGDSLKLYSKGGKDILEMTVDVAHRPFVDDFRVYAFPSSYSPDGLTFADGSDALLDGVLGIADGPNLVVKVGTATIRSSH